MKLKFPAFLKKGAVGFNNLAAIILTLGITAVIITVLSILMNSLKVSSGWVNSTVTTIASNVSENSLSFMNNVSGQFGLLGTIIGLVLVVAIVIGVFRFSGRGGSGI